MTTLWRYRISWRIRCPDSYVCFLAQKTLTWEYPKTSWLGWFTGFTVVERLRNTVKQRDGKVMFTVSDYHHNWIFRMLLEKGVAPPTGISMHLGVVRIWIAHSLNAHPTQEVIFALFFLIPGPRGCFEKLQPLHPIILLEEELFHQSSLRCDEWEVTGWKRHHGHYHEEATECAGLMEEN